MNYYFNTFKPYDDDFDEKIKPTGSLCYSKDEDMIPTQNQIAMYNTWIARIRETCENLENTYPENKLSGSPSFEDMLNNFPSDDENVKKSKILLIKINNYQALFYNYLR